MAPGREGPIGLQRRKSRNTAENLGETGTSRCTGATTGIALAPGKDRPIGLERRKGILVLECAPHILDIACPLIGRQHIQRRFHLQGEHLGLGPLAAGGGNGEGVSACRCWRAAQQTGGRIQGQSGNGTIGYPTPVAGAQGAHLVAAHARAALGSHGCADIGARQPAADAGGLVVGLRRQVVGDRESRACGAIQSAVEGVSPDGDAAVGLLGGKRIYIGKDLGEAGARGGLVGSAIVGVAPRLQRPVSLHGHKGQAVGINPGESSARWRAGAARGASTPGDDRPVIFNGRERVLVGIDGRETGGRGRAGTTPDGVAPHRDAAIGSQRRIGAVVAVDIDEIIAPGKRHFPRQGGAPSLDGAIASQRGKIVLSGKDADVAVVGGRVRAAPIGGVAPDRDRAIALQGREGVGVAADRRVAGAGGRAGTAVIGGTPGGDAAIRLHRGHHTRASEDLGVTRAGGSDAAVGDVAPSGDAPIRLEGGEEAVARKNSGKAGADGRAGAAVTRISPGTNRAVLAQRGKSAPSLKDLDIAVFGRHASSPGPAPGASTPGDNGAIGLECGESVDVEPLPAGGIGRYTRALADALVGQRAIVDGDGEQLRCRPNRGGRRQCELVDARHRGGAADNSSGGCQRQARWQRAGDNLVIGIRIGGGGWCGSKHGQVVADRLADAVIGVTPAFGLPVGCSTPKGAYGHKRVVLALLPAFVVAGHREGVVLRRGGCAFQKPCFRIERHSWGQISLCDRATHAHTRGAYLQARHSVVAGKYHG